MSLPKDLLLANIGVRVIHSKIDSLSPLSKSYKMPKRKTKPEAVVTTSYYMLMVVSEYEDVYVSSVASFVLN